MEKKVTEFLNHVYNSKIGSMKYYTFGYQADYRKMPNYDFGYIPFINELKFEDIETIIPLTNPKNRPGIKKTSTKYICVHDTASGAPSADAIAHKKWLESMANNPESTTWVSWHFTVDDKMIINHIPIDEVAYHAGDGTSTPLEYIDTFIKFDGAVNTTITDDGFFAINGKKTKIEIPRNDNGELVINAKLPALGINYIVNEDGNVCLSNNYYNSGYNTISNRGGNLNSVGIETCVNYGGDYSKTMRINANLVARLVNHFNLTIDKVLQHNSFSGKDCPMTMRYNNRWNEFVNLVSLNLEYNELSKLYEINFISLNSEFLNNEGKIIKNEVGKEIKYKAIVKNKESNEVNEYEYSFILEELNYEED